WRKRCRCSASSTPRSSATRTTTRTASTRSCACRTTARSFARTSRPALSGPAPRPPRSISFSANETGRGASRSGARSVPVPNPDTRPIAIIGAGPSGLAAARNLDRQGVDWVGFDLADDVGGLWNIDSPRSTVYASAHLISSARTTEFAEFPVPADTPDYPDHRRLLPYFRDFADHFG